MRTRDMRMCVVYDPDDSFRRVVLVKDQIDRFFALGAETDEPNAVDIAETIVKQDRTDVDIAEELISDRQSDDKARETPRDGEDR